MAQITYANKVALNENPNINAINKVQDTDMNQIKEVINENETKILLAVTDTEPAECSTGDMYYNTTDNLIYTATATDTWSSTGVAPTENTLYVVLTTQTSYMYDGNTLVSIGGGTGSSDIVMVDPDTPTADTKLYIESMDLDGNYEVNTEIYSTEETLTNKIWIDGKPVYRKVIQFQSSVELVQGSWTTLTSVTGLNISTLLSVTTISNNGCVWNGFLNRIDNNNLQCWNGVTGWGVVTVILEYTKAN